jgi:hypothetical protein
MVHGANKRLSAAPAFTAAITPLLAAASTTATASPGATLSAAMTLAVAVSPAITLRLACARVLFLATMGATPASSPALPGVLRLT